MSFIDFLKNTKKQLLNLQESVEEEPIVETPKIPEIVIENHHSIFDNEEESEEEIILKGAQITLEEKRVDSLEEGIKVFATIFRGLKYRRTETDENGNTKIIFADVDLEDTPQKSL